MKEDVYNNNYNKKDFIIYPVRLLRYLMKKLELKKLLQRHVKDPRYDTIKYSSTSLLMIGLFLYLFRSGSKNNFYQPLYQGRSCRSLAHLAGIDSDRLPDISTIDNLFFMLNPKDLEPIPFALFKWLLTSKVISYSNQSPFFLCIDAYCSHCYNENSSHQPCPYCLPRQRGDTIRYYHMNVIASIVFPGGFQLPLYVYRLRAQQKLLSLSDAKFKQECELTALGPLLSMIRSYLPRVKFCLLLDALYGNNTGITLAEAHGMSYRIVLKNFKTSKVLRSHPVTNKVERGFETSRFHIKQHFAFCRAMRGGRLIHVIDLIETANKKDTGRKAAIHFKRSCWQWVVDQQVNRDNVISMSEEARLRWHQEDFINSCKNRGFNAKHDLSRNHQAQSIWMILLLIAFFLSSLLLHSKLGKEARKKKVSIRAFMERMLQDLIYTPPEELFRCSYPSQLRFSINPQGS